MSLKSTIAADSAPVSQAEPSATSGNGGLALRQYLTALRADASQNVFRSLGT